MAALPSYDQLIWPLIRALRAKGGSATNAELLAAIVEQERIAPDAQAIMMKRGRQSKLDNNLAWAKVYLKKAGAVENSNRGVWSLTSAGERMTEEDTKAVPANVRRMEAEARREQKAATAPDSDPEAPDDAIEMGWKDQLLAVLRSLTPDAFERVAQRVLREAGFSKVDVTGRSGDGGIDGVGVLRINLLSFQVLFQCKRYQGSVGSREIRDFRGAMVGRSDKGLFITTGVFTPDAKREATRDGAPAIELIDGDLLCDLLKDLKLGVRTELVEKVTVDADWLRGV